MSIKDDNLKKIKDALKGTRLSKEEQNTINWLSKNEPETVSNIVSVIEKVSHRAVYLERLRIREANRMSAKCKSKGLDMEL